MDPPKWDPHEATAHNPQETATLDPTSRLPGVLSKPNHKYNARHKAWHVLRAASVPCILWCEDGLYELGVPAGTIHLYLLVADFDTATAALEAAGWQSAPPLGKIGNHRVGAPQRRLTDSTGWDTVLLLARDWNYPPSLLSTPSIAPEYVPLIDSLFNTLLDTYNVPGRRLGRPCVLHLVYLYDYTSGVRTRDFAAALAPEHRQIHLDICAGMAFDYSPVVEHERRVRDAIRAGTWQLVSCSSDSEELYPLRQGKDFFREKPRVVVEVPVAVQGDRVVVLDGKWEDIILDARLPFGYTEWKGPEGWVDDERWSWSSDEETGHKQEKAAVLASYSTDKPASLRRVDHVL